MAITLRIFIIFLGTMFFLTVICLLVKRRISERNSFLWLIGSIIIFGLSVYPNIITWAASFVGVDYPPTLLFLLSILILLFITLFHSIQISILNSHIKELTQYIAINNYTLKQSMTSIDTVLKEYEEANKCGK